jgi:hypothetical protein
LATLIFLHEVEAEHPDTLGYGQSAQRQLHLCSDDTYTSASIRSS